MPKRISGDLFIDGRVAIDPVPLASTKKATIMYKGLLAQSGADAVYLHCGYGHDHWANVKDVPMTKQDDVWVTEVGMEGERKFNFCFKDGANNWDNNSGLNWGCEIV